MDWNDYGTKREQVKDYLREAEQERLARQLPIVRRSFAMPCWLRRRIEYAQAVAIATWHRIRTRDAVQTRPVLADCS